MVEQQTYILAIKDQLQHLATLNVKQGLVFWEIDDADKSDIKFIQPQRTISLSELGVATPLDLISLRKIMEHKLGVPNKMIGYIDPETKKPRFVQPYTIATFIHLNLKGNTTTQLITPIVELIGTAVGTHGDSNVNSVTIGKTKRPYKKRIKEVTEIIPEVITPMVELKKPTTRKDIKGLLEQLRVKHKQQT